MAAAESAHIRQGKGKARQSKEMAGKARARYCWVRRGKTTKCNGNEKQEHSRKMKGTGMQGQTSRRTGRRDPAPADDWKSTSTKAQADAEDKTRPHGSQLRYPFWNGSARKSRRRVTLRVLLSEETGG